MNADDVKTWLREHGAATIDHPGGTLYAHLGRVHDRLGALGHGPDVRLAGLTHAVYGTDGFDRTRQVWNRWTGSPDSLLQGFADLSIVDELDVVEQDPTIAQRYGGYFRDVFASWQGLASEPVLAEARRVLGA